MGILNRGGGSEGKEVGIKTQNPKIRPVPDPETGFSQSKNFNQKFYSKNFIQKFYTKILFKKFASRLFGVGIFVALKFEKWKKELIPFSGTINTDGLSNPVNWDELFSLPKEYWKSDSKEIHGFFEQQIGADIPAELRKEMEAQEKRIESM